MWRLLQDGALVVTDREDGLTYGEPTAIDAEARAQGLLKGRRVLAAMIHPETADLSLALEGRVRLEVISVAARGEAWHLSRGERGFTIAAAEGRLSEPGRLFARPESSTLA
jgi:hypothetical protein